MAQIVHRKGTPGVLPHAWLIQPRMAQAGPPIVAVHGIMRDAERMAHLLAPRAEEIGRTVVLPIFDRTSWRRYQRAACGQRADWALLALLKTLRDEGQIADGPVDLSGYSGGAQFSHRFAWLYPEKVARLCLVAPGWWTFPNASGAYPFGLGGGEDGLGTFWLKANLRRFLDREIHVAVGACDLEQDQKLRQDPEVTAQQGPTRVARARAWCAAMTDATQAEGLPPRVTYRELPGCGHSFEDCVTLGGLAEDFLSPSQTPVPTQAPIVDCDPIEEVA